VGRISHPDFHGGELPVAPSAISPGGEVITPTGNKPRVAPRALELSEIHGIVAQFRTGAENAKRAGFDGVEIHGANGYLLDQFTRDGANKRTDAYGGSIANRARLPLEVTRAVIDVWGAERVGYRISPTGAFNAMSDSGPVATFSYLTDELNKLGLGYLHVVDPIVAPKRVAPILREIFDNTFVVNGGFDVTQGNDAIARGDADLVAFGVPFLANPDLPRRFEEAAPLNPADQATFYVGEEKGYTDYPVLS
jgi:N-ethylmaleimide reductase